MRFQLPTLGPRVRAIVMIDVAEEEASVGPVDDEPDIAADANGPEPLVLRFIELMELQARMGRVQLEIEKKLLLTPPSA